MMARRCISYPLPMPESGAAALAAMRLAKRPPVPVVFLKSAPDVKSVQLPERRADGSVTSQDVRAVVAAVSGFPIAGLSRLGGDKAMARWRHVGIKVALEETTEAKSAIGVTFGARGKSMVHNVLRDTKLRADRYDGIIDRVRAAMVVYRSGGRYVEAK